MSTEPARHAWVVTESDSATLEPLPRGIYIKTGGSLIVDMEGGEVDVDFGSVPAGLFLPVQIKRVKTASTAVVIAVA